MADEQPINPEVEVVAIRSAKVGWRRAAKGKATRVQRAKAAKSGVPESRGRDAEAQAATTAAMGAAQAQATQPELAFEEI